MSENADGMGMCGIVGVISEYPVERRDVLAMRDELVHRGPDDAGVLATVCGTLGHQRLSVIDPTDGGHQPMTAADGRYVLVYNGELYNDLELRKELEQLGVVFKSRCDTETVLHALIHWGVGARHKFRGMYAFGFVDVTKRTVLFGRDSMGIKPLYLAKIGGAAGGLLFASEIRAILVHRKFEVRPDLLTMSAYLSTIRPEFGKRTMFEGVSSLEPGEWSGYSTSTFECLESCSCWDDRVGVGVGVGVGGHADVGDTRSVIEDSVIRHLRTDVPMCAMLSGGIDSSIIAKIAMDELGELHTFCAGARVDGFADDFEMARKVARYLGTQHTEVEIDSAGFLSQWRRMIDATGVPMSTPNEVAIFGVCSALRERGFTVALSGEGADELFGGYEMPMRQAQSFVDHIPDSDLAAGLFHLRSNAWVSDELKPQLMQEQWCSETDSDSLLKVWYQLSFEKLRAESTDSMQAHLAFHRRMNLPNLLRRLDTASMLCSVEGRTPFADRSVADFAQSLAMKDKFVDGNPAGTKIALREAFAGRLPDEVVARPKASFPLPFQEWIGERSAVLEKSAFAKHYFCGEAIDAVLGDGGDVGANWNLAWPMMNLAIWGERWWGDREGRGVVDEVFEGAGSGV